MQRMSTDSLFTQAAYLDPLAHTGCVGGDSGWMLTPIRGAYLKTHSWGEFVFDHAFARAYAQQGLAYYPKLTVCTPFTPVPASRIANAQEAAHLQAFAQAHGASGVHALFLPAPEAEQLASQGWLRREQTRYVWRNRDYPDFDAFAAALNSKRRKNLRKERSLIADAGYRIQWRRAIDLDDTEWIRIHAYYADTYHARGMAPYLNLACLRAWARHFSEQFWFCLAYRDGDCVAMAWYFEDGERLCGRHWGSAGGHALLHFELCCYQGIERAIARGLKVFDAGVQGEHKLLRGFEAECSHSAHWFAHPGFHEAIARYLQRERQAVETEIGMLAQHHGYRRSSAADIDPARLEPQ